MVVGAVRIEGGGGGRKNVDEEEQAEEAEEGGEILTSVADGAATGRGSVVTAAAVVVVPNVALTTFGDGTRGQSYCNRTNRKSITSSASFNSWDDPSGREGRAGIRELEM